MPLVLAVALGGALGAVSRYGLDRAIESRSASSFPWATLAVNVSGCLLVGFLISLFQAATQIQEQTLSFVPKMIAVAIALLVSGNWVLSELVSFTQSLFDMLPTLLGRT